MFGSLGVPELLMILAVALIVFGPRRLPEIGRTLGKALGEFKKATDDFKSTIEREVRIEELKQINPSLNVPVETVSRNKPVEANETVSAPPAEVTQSPTAISGDAMPAATSAGAATVEAGIESPRQAD